MPSIIQSLCPEKLSFVSTVPEYFSRSHVFPTHRQRHTEGHNEDILTFLFVESMAVCMGGKKALLTVFTIQALHIDEQSVKNVKKNSMKLKTSGNKEGKPII